ncbi:hypothetical protein, partial [Streptomyces spiramenti]|uniref:hypothetical protein n=1 Tax=Streptomyces spiramenti TaxID=2720606 RepID=UPI00308456AC
AGAAAAPLAPGELTVVVLPPRNATTRGQLLRMSGLARDEGHQLLWREVRGPAGPGAWPALARRLRTADRLVIGDPFSRWAQLLLAGAETRRVVVVDDGTATMEFTAQLSRGEPLVRWHRAAPPRGARAALFAPVARRALRGLSPVDGREVEVFTAMPVEHPAGVTVRRNELAWTRGRFGPPQITGGSDLVGTSLVETGIIHEDRYLGAVASLAAEYGVTRYLAHRKEGPEKLKRVAALAGVEIVRPDLPLELVARTGPIGRRVLSFPSTVVHTLPLVLRGTESGVSVCEITDDWLTERASPRAGGFLAAVIASARGAHGLPVLPVPLPPPTAV